MLPNIPMRSAIYYGWIQAAMLSITQLVSWGILYYAFSVLIAPMQAELQWTSAQITGAFSLALLANGVSSLLTGRWLDRHGPRLLMSLGSIAATLLVLVWSQVQSLWMFYILWVAIGISMSAVLYEPAFWVIAKWFSRKRGRALTVVTFGGGLASTVFLPLTNALVVSLSWRMAVMVLAAILATLTILPHALLLRRSPADIGATVDGTPLASVPITEHPMSLTAKHNRVVTSTSLQTALRLPSFWIYSLTFALSALAWSGMSVHLIAYSLTRGISASHVAGVASIIGVVQVAGRLVLGPLSDRLSRDTITFVLFLVQALSFLALIILPPEVALWVYVVCFGLGFGVITPLRAALIADVYGTQHYGVINSTMSISASLARAIAPVGVGLLVGVFGYGPVPWLCMLVCLIATFAFWSLTHILPTT